ncbi:protein DOG1-like 4 [Actinidia eriantha]|uniref:protein DOG1-like 4 n=1 Tax=Actinidia eriantha TaxID=165200 RepID=UPI00258DE2EE|nr:protein DOG1-like 4 [Actinidia eriantha]
MAQAIPKGGPERETFQKFFECWLVQQDQLLQELISASKSHHPNPNNNRATTTESNTESSMTESTQLRSLIDRVIEHYENYYRAKSRWAKEDVLAMLSPSWRSTLEDAFLWIGGWRPSMAFHLLYSKSGLQLEAIFDELIRGLRTGDLADLSPSQLNRVDELQRTTIRNEKDVTEKMAKVQETLADTSMVELSHAVSDMRRGGDADVEEERVESVLGPKEEGLEEVLHSADVLRLRTLKSVVEILTPIQAVHYLIAAAELHLRFHEWGKKKDAKIHDYHRQDPSPSEQDPPRH